MTQSLSSFAKKLLLAAAGSMAFTLIDPPVSWAQAPATGTDTHAKGDIAGNWQGTLQVANKSLRLIVAVTKTDKGWAAKFYSIDQTPQPFNAALSLTGSAVKLSIDMVGGTFDGNLSADGNSMTGTWTQAANPLPLTLVRAGKETAWEIPAPGPPPKMMPADANPSFDVATIKPNDSGSAGLQGLGFSGRSFMTRNSSLNDLIAFAYSVQDKQIVNAPDWTGKDRYDLSAIPDVEGIPTVAQMRVMLQKLLADRFKLTFHQEKRDMSAFVLTVVKTGEKLTPTEDKGPGPGIGFVPAPGGLKFIVKNGTVAAFTTALQMVVLDRPVVDQTGLTGHYDISLTFSPDDSQFNGHPPIPPKTDKTDTTTESAPSLFEAIQKQLGLKLDAQKTAVDVIAIDHVEKPSAN
jgi:uncharacterized protein (TIGR03435 family)